MDGTLACVDDAIVDAAPHRFVEDLEAERAEEAVRFRHSLDRRRDRE